MHRARFEKIGCPLFGLCQVPNRAHYVPAIPSVTEDEDGSVYTFSDRLCRRFASGEQSVRVLSGHRVCSSSVGLPVQFSSAMLARRMRQGKLPLRLSASIVPD